MEICINVYNYENIKIRSNEHSTLKECAIEIIKEISPLVNMETEEYILNYLIPLIYDKPRDIKSFKRKREFKENTKNLTTFPSLKEEGD